MGSGIRIGPKPVLFGLLIALAALEAAGRRRDASA